MDEKLFSKGNNKLHMETETDKWFNSAFENFVNTEIVGAIFEPDQ